MNKEKAQMYEDTISLIIVGDQAVGKTSLMKRFTDNTFTDDILGTVGNYRI
jgi:GTPase SAR1 family protein